MGFYILFKGDLRLVDHVLQNSSIVPTKSASLGIGYKVTTMWYTVKVV